MLVAAAGVPVSFQRTLMPRSTMDQAFEVGVSAAAHYGLTIAIQDVIEAIGLVLSGASTIDEADDDRWRNVVGVLNLGVLAGGLALQRTNQQVEGEPLPRAVRRSAGYWLSMSATAAGLVGLTQRGLARIDRRYTNTRLRAFPAAVPAAVVVAAAAEFRRRQRAARFPDSGVYGEDQSVSGAKALAYGSGISSLLLGIAATEKLFASTLESLVGRVAPGHTRIYRPLAHAIALTTLGFGVKTAIDNVYRRVERDNRRIEPAYDAAPKSPMVSGSTESLCAYDTLDLEGRRFVGNAITRELLAVVDDHADVTKFADPIRAYVGLNSAPTAEERVDLALRELRRTGAFDRRVLMAVSPTGTGYVNYVACESLEFLTGGNCAIVALQYSERPSPLSLDRVWQGREHFRLLIDAIATEIASRPRARRPRLVVFGESLGAHTSQDAFLHQGTQGLLDVGIDHALWIGTPFASEWKQEVLGPDRPDTDPALIGVFDRFEQYSSLSPADRRALRYVMITHDNDAVAKFGLDLLVQAPEWLGPPASRPDTVPHSEVYRTPTTFVQTFVDMKNAATVVAGEFEAKGHDYRADLLPFFNALLAFDVDDARIARITEALRDDELARKQRLDDAKAAVAAAAAAAKAKAAPGHDANPTERN